MPVPLWGAAYWCRSYSRLCRPGDRGDARLFIGLAARYRNFGFCTFLSASFASRFRFARAADTACNRFLSRLLAHSERLSNSALRSTCENEASPCPSCFRLSRMQTLFLGRREEEREKKKDLAVPWGTRWGSAGAESSGAPVLCNEILQVHTRGNLIALGLAALAGGAVRRIFVKLYERAAHDRRPRVRGPLR
jgi:hypothetical protein